MDKELLKLRDQVEAFFEKANNNKEKKIQFRYADKVIGRHRGNMMQYKYFNFFLYR